MVVADWLGPPANRFGPRRVTVAHSARAAEVERREVQEHCVCPGDLDQALAWLAWPSGSTSCYLAHLLARLGRVAPWTSPRRGVEAYGQAPQRGVVYRHGYQRARRRGYQVEYGGNRVGAPRYTSMEGTKRLHGAFRRETRPWRWVAAVERPIQMAPHGRGTPTRGEGLAGVYKGGKSEVVLLPDPPSAIHAR